MNIWQNKAPILLLIFSLLVPVCIPALADTAQDTGRETMVITERISPLSVPISEKTGPIRIGVLANRGADIAIREWGPTAEYLSRTLAPARFVVVPLDFDEIRKTVEDGDIDFICANPSVYTGLEYYGLGMHIATLQVPGEPYPQAVFGGVIFTRKDRSDIQDLSDLRGRSFVAVDPTSLGGWQAAWAEMLKAGINPENDLSSVTFANTHDATVFAVLTGEADAGTVRSTQLERMAEEGRINLSDIKVLNQQEISNKTYPFLLSTPLYPEWPFAAVWNTDKRLSKDVSVALLMMDEDDPAARAVRGAGWAVPQDHTTVHELLRSLNLPPYEQYGRPTIREVINQYWHTILGILVGIIVLSGMLIYTWRTKKDLATALVLVRESEDAIRRSKEDLEVTNARLAESQEKILDSIYYAKMIQQSVFPPQKVLRRYLKEHFALLKPLDIVGGDFYALKMAHDGFIIAVIDCTGHGVPGALMTMMASTQLTWVIDTNPDDSPAQLLEKLHVLVRETLKAQSETRHFENGFDIALCRVYPDTGRLIFAGAGLPLIIAEGGSVREVAGDRLHIGFSTQKAVTFSDHTVPVTPDTQLFLVTDGILDLPGGESGFGLGKKKLLSLLQDISSYPVQEQKEQLLARLKVYQGQWASKDDMTIVGFVVR